MPDWVKITVTTLERDRIITEYSNSCLANGCQNGSMILSEVTVSGDIALYFSPEAYTAFSTFVNYFVVEYVDRPIINRNGSIGFLSGDIISFNETFG